MGPACEALRRSRRAHAHIHGCAESRRAAHRCRSAEHWWILTAIDNDARCATRLRTSRQRGQHATPARQQATRAAAPLTCNGQQRRVNGARRVLRAPRGRRSRQNKRVLQSLGPWWGRGQPSAAALLTRLPGPRRAAVARAGRARYAVAHGAGCRGRQLCSCTLRQAGRPRPRRLPGNASSAVDALRLSRRAASTARLGAAWPSRRCSGKLVHGLLLDFAGAGRARRCAARGTVVVGPTGVGPVSHGAGQRSTKVPAAR